MSNELETKLRGLINELQGLYRQCTADIEEIKRKTSALEEKIDGDLETVDEGLQKHFKATNKLAKKIEALKSIIKIIVKPLIGDIISIDEIKQLRKQLDEKEVSEENNKITIYLPEEMLKTGMFAKFRETLFEFLESWKLKFEVSNNDTVIKVSYGGE